MQNLIKKGIIERDEIASLSRLLETILMQEHDEYLGFPVVSSVDSMISTTVTKVLPGTG